ncbi:HAD family hydrolase [Aestuariivirga sp.]|uniref:HAD family hydrolase n=1 Tax=Aestuariivirga sp. TaxID=2650926 RepID=UPI0035944692
MADISRREALRLALAATATLAVTRLASANGAVPLPSWKDGPALKRIVDFVTATTTEGGPDYVAPADRIAVFDNDGTLWCENPIYFQAAFAFDRIKMMAPDHPEWKDQEPYKSLLSGDMRGLMAQGEHGLLEIVMETHAGMSVDAFQAIVAEWLKTARHPRFDRPYDSLVYQPMLELLAYMRANGYQTWIVSGGGIEFMRTFAERTYGIPPEQLIGSSIVTKFEILDGKPELMRLPKIDFIDDKDGKPVGINKFIGKRPVFAAGNSDGDLQMLQWTTSGTGPRFGMIVHHTDAEREYAYDRDSHIGQLDKALDAAPAAGWLVVDMKSDWLEVFPKA